MAKIFEIWRLVIGTEIKRAPGNTQITPKNYFWGLFVVMIILRGDEIDVDCLAIET